MLMLMILIRCISNNKTFIGNAAKTVSEFEGHSFDVVGCEFSTLSGKDVIVSASKDGAVMCWHCDNYFFQDNIQKNSNHSNNSKSESDNHHKACLLTVNTGKIITCLSILPKESLPIIVGHISNSDDNNGNSNFAQNRKRMDDNDDSYRDDDSIMLSVGSIDGSVTILNIFQKKGIVKSEIICSTKSLPTNSA